MNAIIIEDEKNNAERLERMLSRHCPEIILKKTAASVQEGILAINEFNPDILFLDIELPDGTGFEIFDHFSSPAFEVIFTTAFDKFAIKAIKFSAADYLLKPIDKEELIAAVEKVKSLKDDSSKSRNISFFKEKHKNQLLNNIALPTSDGYKIVSIDQIIRCEADGNYTRFHLDKNEKILVSKSLKEFEDLLEDCNFCRVHHSHLINMKHAVKYQKGEGGYVIMSDNASVEVSKRKKDQFLKQLFKA